MRFFVFIPGVPVGHPWLLTLAPFGAGEVSGADRGFVLDQPWADSLWRTVRRRVFSPKVGAEELEADGEA
jgi:hypothetical protein